MKYFPWAGILIGELKQILERIEQNVQIRFWKKVEAKRLFDTRLFQRKGKFCGGFRFPNPPLLTNQTTDDTYASN